MMRSLAPDRERASLAVAAAVIALVVPSTLGQVGAILLGGVVGLALLPKMAVNTNTAHLPISVGRTRGAALLACFFILLAGLPWLAANLQIHSLQLVDAFYRAGSLVFGGGHVVLPLLQASVVPPGWVTNDAFLAGYGAAQAVPGPLFTFAAYLGAVMGPQPNGWTGAGLLPCRDLLAVVFARDRYDAVLGQLASSWLGSVRVTWSECICRRCSACRAVQSCLEGGHHRALRLRAGGRSLPALVHVADTALDRRGVRRPG
jgi:chromate transport protein ChrA